jgi:ribose transport system substrate-binding protein
VAGGVVSLALIVSSCSSSGSFSQSTNSSTSDGQTAASSAAVAQAKALVAQYEAAPAKIAQAAPLPSPAPKGKSIIFLEQGAVPAVVQVGLGEKAAAAAVGWSFSTIDYDPSNATSIQSAFQTALQKKPTVVSITGTDPSSFGASTIADFKQAGIPIIVSTTGNVPSDPTIIGDPGGPPSYALAGKALAVWVVADSNGTGNVLLAHVPDFAILASFTDPFQAEMKALCPACQVKLVNATIAQATGGQEAQVVAAAAKANPGYKYVIYDDGDFATGINSALSAAGISGLKVGGADFQPEQAAALRAGTQAVWTGNNVLNIGYSVVDAALRYVEGAPQNHATDAEPTQLLTKATIGSMNSFILPSDALQQFEKLWQVPLTS